MNKMKIAVLFGGQSTEHEVSCMSAYSVLKNIDYSKFQVTAIGITKQGDWSVYGGDLDSIKNGAWKKNVPLGCGMAPALRAVYESDAVFPVIHGIMAEDGTLQGLLELIGKPYVGPGVLASAVCMDKAYTKIILNAAGVPQCRYIVAFRDIILKNDGTYEREVEESFGFPVLRKAFEFRLVGRRF